MNKLQIKQAVIVEGRYDRAVLESVIDAVIIPVNGFGVYKDKKLLAMIRRYAETTGVILLTDSDNAGRQIRDFLKSFLQGCEVTHIYVPNLSEVEDTSTAILRAAFMKFNTSNDFTVSVTRERLFDDGLIGCANCAKKRKALLALADLPENLSVTALLDLLNRCGYDYEKLIKEI